MREQIITAARVVVKVGSSSLATPAGELDVRRLRELADVLADRVALGQQVVLVTSGAVAAGIGPLGLPGRPRALATQQAAASVGQGLLLSRYAALFGAHDLTVGQVLLTVEDMTRRASHANALRTFTRLLELGVVPIVNENDTTATDEITFGDNDFLDNDKCQDGWGYCVFGRVTEGQDVVDKIKGVKTGNYGRMHQDVPTEDVVITKVTLAE